MYNVFLLTLIMYTKIHVPTMLAIGVEMINKQTNKQPQWLENQNGTLNAQSQLNLEKKCVCIRENVLKTKHS